MATDVVGYLVELVSGQSYADFVRQQILTPLGMTDTDFLVPEDKRDRFAACYMLKDGRLELFDDSQKAPISSRRPSWNPAAAGWWARRPIICASAACC